MSDDPNPRAGILCAGTILVDAGKVIDAYPALDHLTTIERISLSTGGPALNMAVDLRMLGAAFPIGVLGAVGDDEHAAFILAECARLGINTDGVRKLAGAVTSFTDVMVEKDGGRRTMFHHSGANALFDASTAELETSAARMLHTGAPGIHPFMDSRRPDGGNGWSALLQRGQAAGLHTNMELVSLQPGRTAETALGCLPYLDSIVINELEAGALTGIDVSVPTADGPVDWPGIEAMALGLIERGVARIHLVNRSLDRAQALAQRFGAAVMPAPSTSPVGVNPLVRASTMSPLVHSASAAPVRFGVLPLPSGEGAPVSALSGSIAPSGPRGV